jgi:Ca2+-binding EF-hand superfamily protein
MKTNRTSSWTIGAVLAIGMIAGIPAASGQKTSGDSSGAKLWLSAMDTDKDGTVSKQEFLSYMAAQFEKADPDHDGTLDKNEMEQLRQNLGIAPKQDSTTAADQNTSANSAGAKLWMSAMDKDKEGTVSKQEFLSFMDAQFDKADPDNDKVLDKKEMALLRKNLGIAAK